MVSSTPRPHFTPGKDPVPIVQEAGWVPGPVWTGGKTRPHRDSIPDHPVRSKQLYRLSYPAHRHMDYSMRIQIANLRYELPQSINEQRDCWGEVTVHVTVGIGGACVMA